MTQNEVGAYIMLLAHGWNTQGLKADDLNRLKILAKGDVSDHVLGKFKLKNGRLFNKRQEHERKKQSEYRAKQAVNGAKGGRPMKKPKPNPSLSSGETQTEPKKSSPSPSPSPSPKEELKKCVSASLDEVKLVCAKSGLPELDAIWFWNKCEANGWTNAGKPIKSWPHTIASWKAAGYLPSQKPSSQNGYEFKPSQKTLLENEIERL